MTPKRPARRNASGAPSPSPTLTEITVGGFKSIRDRQQIEIRPLTLFGGKNSSGKSSIMQPLLLLKQTLDAPFDPGPLRLDGENARFNEVEQLFWRGTKRTDRAKEFMVGFSGGETPSSLVFRREADGVAIDRMEIQVNRQTRTIRESTSASELLDIFPELDNPANFVPLVERHRCFLDVLAKDPDDDEVYPSPVHLFADAGRALESLIHLPGLRGNPQRLYPAAQVGRALPGLFHSYTASIIAAWQKSKDPRLATLGGWLQELELTWRVEARSVHGSEIELWVGRLPGAARGGTKDLVSIADVGFGVSQTLPLLVALLVATPGQIVYVEQPEIHLHPKAQIELAGCLLDAANRGVRVIAETHSNLLIKGVQARIAENPDLRHLVKLHWFERDDDGATQVFPADLDEHGAFGAWREDLSAAEAEIDNRFLDVALTSSRT